MKWVIMENFNNYAVNDIGEVKNIRTNRILKQQVNTHGYKIISLRVQKNVSKTIGVHILVASAFLGKRPTGYIVNHKDGNKQNNNASNLEYTTYSGNLIHAYKTGLHKPINVNEILVKRGEDNYMSKLTEQQVIDILKLHYKTGYGYRKIAKELQLPLGAVQGVLSTKRPRWCHIDREVIKQQVLKENGG